MSWRRAARTFPRPLTVLLVLVALVGCAWALASPAGQAPDEPTHFAYVQSLATRFELPGDPSRPEFSTAAVDGMQAGGASLGTYAPADVAPDWNPVAWRAYNKRQRISPPSTSNGGGPNITAGANGPFYYAFAAVGYSLDRHGSWFGQVLTIRLWDLLILLTTTAAAWLLAGEVFGGRQVPQLVAAGTVALLPMMTYITETVTTDAMLPCLWTLALWLAARVIRRRGQLGDAAALSLVTGLAILSKGTSYVLLLPLGSAFLAALWLSERETRVKTLLRVAAAASVLVAIMVGWFVYAHLTGRAGLRTISGDTTAWWHSLNFLSYLWQWYLPRLPFMHVWSETTPTVPSFAVWLQEGFGWFGWLNISLAGWVYDVVAWIAALVSVSAVACLWRSPSHSRLTVTIGACTALLLVLSLTHQLMYAASIPMFALLALLVQAVRGLLKRASREASLTLLTLVISALGLLLLLHVADYLVLRTQGTRLSQGRYLLPDVGLVGLCVGLLVSRLPPRLHGAAGGAVLTLLLGAQVMSLAAVTTAFYL
jgi:4-amino-4-deoxy-L-arabinose transferase-like glycosyltransferase